MEIRKIQGLILGQLLVIGLTACSSSPSWNESDNSPWKNKRDTDANNVATEEFVEVSLDDPAQILPERESMFETMPELEPEFEPMMMEEPVEVMSSSVVSDSDIANAPASAYAVQAMAARNVNHLNDYVSAHGLDQMQIVKTDRDGEVMHVLVSIHSDRGAAIQSAQELEERTGSKPWVRSIRGLQSILAQ